MLGTRTAAVQILTCARSWTRFQHPSKHLLLCRHSRPFTQRRRYAAAESWLTTKTDEESGIAIIEMNRKPVNSLNFEFITQLDITLEKLETDRTCRGVILTSGLANIFSAGLDITEMYGAKEDRAAEFWKALQHLWLRLYGSELVTFAAITGHSPAGGCLLAVSCDYRAMVSQKFSIGLNEVYLGVVAPFWFADIMLHTVGHRQTEKALQLGTLFSAEDALKVGLVDFVATDQQSVLQHCQDEMKKWLRVPDAARILTKNMLRRPILDKMRNGQEEDVRNFLSLVLRDSVQKQLGLYLQSLKNKK